MNSLSVQPYLNVSGRCEEALEFYSTTLGAKVEKPMRFNESPEPLPPGMLAPGFENKVMHVEFRIGETALMAFDGMGKGPGFASFSLTLAVTTEAEAHRFFAALAEGGTATMPLAKTFWSPCFGMLTDRFGLSWMINMVPAADGNSDHPTEQA